MDMEKDQEAKNVACDGIHMLCTCPSLDPLWDLLLGHTLHTPHILLSSYMCLHTNGHIDNSKEQKTPITAKRFYESRLDHTLYSGHAGLDILHAPTIHIPGKYIRD